MAKKKPVLPEDDRPALTMRPVFMQCIQVRKCRFNPSMAGFQRLPAFLKVDLIEKRKARHGESLPPLEISTPKPRSKR